MLSGAGSISQNDADARAETEYEHFVARRRALLEAEGERTNLKALEDTAKALHRTGRRNHPQKAGRAMKLHFEANLDYQLAAHTGIRG